MRTTSDTVVNVEGISKRYRLGSTIRHDTLRDAVSAGFSRLIGRGAGNGDGRARAQEDFWALKDVSFTVGEGEVVGIIGRNGAGKSTLLKILSRITDPTEGTARLRGRVTSLLEVGTGFHPELTGRENVFLNGAILGMGKAEIKRKFDEIVDFAEIEKFLDTPVKRYSSGMYVRLAFAVAAHLEPEILIVDEVLAVGDAAFQKKCLGKMQDVSRGGRTVLFVSHNMVAVENLCNKCFLLDSGRMVHSGSPAETIRGYMERTREKADSTPLEHREDRTGNGKIRLTSFRMEDGEGRPISQIRSGGDTWLVFGFVRRSEESLRDVSVGFSFSTSNGQLLFVLYSSYMGTTFDYLPMRGEFRCKVKDFPLSAGRYLIGARVTVCGEEADWPAGIASVEVTPGDFYGSGSNGFGREGMLLVNGEWSMEETDER